MKKFLVLTVAVTVLAFSSACGSSANAVEKQANEAAEDIQEDAAESAKDIKEDIEEANLADVIKDEAVSADQPNLYNLTGVVTDASMNTITIETEQGSVITLSTDDDTKTEYKDGLLIGINVMVTVECDIDSVESDMDVDVVSVKEL